MGAIDLANARVLLTNDDGIEAPGIAVLEKLIAPLVRELWVIAPRYEQSATSHALTIHTPLRVHHLGERRKAVAGTPTDAALLALRHVMKEPPDLVISGTIQNLVKRITFVRKMLVSYKFRLCLLDTVVYDVLL